MLGTHLVKSYSTTQQTLALSSGEAEYAAIVKGVAVSLGVRSILADFGIVLPEPIRINTDATTGRSIAMRRGLGKIRHLSLQLLWVQQRVQAGEVRIHKVSTHHNAADLFTKHHQRKQLEYILSRMHVRLVTNLTA